MGDKEKPKIYYIENNILIKILDLHKQQLRNSRNDDKYPFLMKF